MMATIHDTLATDANWFLHKIEPVQRQALFVRVSRDELRLSAFLDERLLQGNREGGWLSLDSLPEILPANAVRRHIFHIGHCGSTLISRLLDHWPNVLGLREPLALRTLAELEENAGSPLARFEPRDLPPLRKTVMALLGRPFASGQNTIIKATSSCNCLIRPMLEIGRAHV